MRHCVRCSSWKCYVGRIGGSTRRWLDWSTWRTSWRRIWNRSRAKNDIILIFNNQRHQFKLFTCSNLSHPSHSPSPPKRKPMPLSHSANPSFSNSTKPSLTPQPPSSSPPSHPPSKPSRKMFPNNETSSYNSISNRSSTSKSFSFKKTTRLPFKRLMSIKSIPW